MKRVSRQPDAILCSDIHLRLDRPVCRTDDYQAAEWKKLNFINDLVALYECPVLCAGDVFDYWKASPELLSHAMVNMPKMFHTVYGQHDLPQHNSELAYKSGLTTLNIANFVFLLSHKPKNMSYTFAVQGIDWKHEPADF